MTEEILQEIRDHAAREYPRESCGVVIIRKGRERYVPCRNQATTGEHFILDHEEYAAAEEQGEVVMIVHSHPNAPPIPSQADRVSCESTGVPWLIMNWPTGNAQIFEPGGYRAPLVGRQFCFGVLDCYTLIRDYYRETLQIELPDFPRRDGFWHRGEELYLDHFEEAGFVPVEPASLRPHDVVLMRLSSPVVNHGAIYLGDDRILHHPMHRLSSRDVYGGYWHHITARTIRHRRVL